MPSSIIPLEIFCRNPLLRQFDGEPDPLQSHVSPLPQGFPPDAGQLPDKRTEAASTTAVDDDRRSPSPLVTVLQCVERPWRQGTARPPAAGVGGGETSHLADNELPTKATV